MTDGTELKIEIEKLKQENTDVHASVVKLKQEKIALEKENI